MTNFDAMCARINAELIPAIRARAGKSKIVHGSKRAEDVKHYTGRFVEGKNPAELFADLVSKIPEDCAFLCLRVPENTECRLLGFPGVSVRLIRSEYNERMIYSLDMALVENAE